MAQTQTLIPGWDQEKLEASRVLVIGAGGLGGPFAQGLAQAGVGELHICDKDDVQASNLNRQLFTQYDIGRPKAHRLVENLHPYGCLGTDVFGHAVISQAFLEQSQHEFSLIFVGVDNSRARKHAARVGLQRRIPVLCATLAVDGNALQVSVQEPDGACLKCILWDSLDEEGDERLPCDGAPVTAALTGTAASFALHASLSILAGGLRFRWNELTIFPELGQSFARTAERREDCPLCGERSQP